MFVAFKRLVPVAAVGLVVGLLPASSATALVDTAARTRPAPAPTAVAAARPDEAFVRMSVPISRRVVRPGMPVWVIAFFFNDGKPPRRIRVRFSAWCHPDRRGWSPYQWVYVRPDPERQPNFTIDGRAARIMTIPKECRHEPGGFLADGIYEVEMGVPTYGSLGNYFIIGAPFTRSNFRYNLTLKTGKRASENSHAHHTMPQKFEARFKEAKINIHDPEYMLWWCRPSHLRNAASYNKRWELFFKAHPKPTVRQVFAFRAWIMKLYTYECPKSSRLTSSMAPV
jgi:hypothetical protein